MLKVLKHYSTHAHKLSSSSTFGFLRHGFHRGRTRRETKLRSSLVCVHTACSPSHPKSPQGCIPQSDDPCL